MEWLMLLPVVAGVGGFLVGYSNVRRACIGGLGPLMSSHALHWAKLDEGQSVPGKTWEPLRHDDFRSSFDWPTAKAWDVLQDVADGLCVNPATGLRMLSDNPCGIDVGGNLYGLSDSLSRHSSWDHSISLDTFSSLSSGHDWL